VAIWKGTQKRILHAAIAGALMALLGCEVEKTADGEMPSVDVDAEAGQMPEYEIVKTQEGEMPDVDVDADPGKLPEYDVDMVDVDVDADPGQLPEYEVVKAEEGEMPDVDIDVDMPDDEDDSDA